MSPSSNTVFTTSVASLDDVSVELELEPLAELEPAELEPDAELAPDEELELEPALELELDAPVPGVEVDSVATSLYATSATATSSESTSCTFSFAQSSADHVTTLPPREKSTCEVVV